MIDMHERPHPSLYQVNTRVWLQQLGRELNRVPTLDDIPDAALDDIAAMGFDWVWFLSVWQTGAAGRRISRSNPAWRSDFQETLPDLREDDIVGSGFAITGYIVDEKLGGDAALARLRERLQARGLRLMLDFVPNHTGLDHPWVDEHPEYYIPGTQADRASAPDNYTCVKSRGSDLILAYGRDPYFSGWPDTLQLDYSSPATQEAMAGELLKIASRCDVALREVLEPVDDADHHGEEDDRGDHRERDVPEPLPRAGPLDIGRLVQLPRHVEQGRQEDDHRVPHAP